MESEQGRFILKTVSSFLCLIFFCASVLAKPVLLAQAEDPYDPFADYSDFDDSPDEEADVYFLRNGRFVTFGLTGGSRILTSKMREAYSDSMTFGGFFSYFFDLRFAVQVSFESGSSHNIQITTTQTKTTYTGVATISTVSLSLKYYFNTQNITQGLAVFNPYLIGGVVRASRKFFLDSFSSFGPAEDGTTGFELGAGIELPLLRKKMFFGLQVTYQLVTFADENTEIRPDNNEPTGFTPEGDFVSAKAALGVNL
ncbi:MAG: hypothetical protein D6797_05685 [Bdellovibrio sp.]|nr:MAG: hypothetical protein D6797_05685 [Bdellovibrio sp.]